MDTYHTYYWILYTLYIFLTQLYGITLAESGNLPGTKDFCLNEGFEAKCNRNEIIVMTSANYGRMHLNRCVVRDYGFVGCGNDVNKRMTAICSGRSTCTIANLEATFADSLGSCPKDLKPYLEASWKCLKVVQGRPDLCAYGYLNVPGNNGYIANSVTEADGFGSSECPWVIKGQPGQKINITLVDFSQMSPHETKDSHGVRPRYCREYATLKEARGSKSLVVCDGDPETKHIYISDNNIIEVEIEKAQSKDTNFRFLLHYQIVGCPLPEPPAYTHIEQEGDKLTVRCNYTSESWSLVCRDNSWVGHIGNCTQAAVTGVEPSVGTSSFLPLGITVIIIIGVAMVICISTLIVGLYHLKRKRAQELLEQQRKEDSLLYGTPRGQELKVENHRFATIDRPGTKHYSQMSGTVRSTTTGGGEYTHIWEVRRPDLPLPDIGDGHCGTLSKPAGCSTLIKDPQCANVHHCGTLPNMKRDTQGDTPTKDPKDRNKEIKKRASFSTFKPSDSDHIYQSPRIDRDGKHPLHHSIHRHHGHHGDVPFYFELDPKMVPTETCAMLSTGCAHGCDLSHEQQGV